MPETIEAEVIAIDGRPPDGGTEAGGRRPDPGRYGERFRQRVLELDRRWWPLWTVLGVLLVAGVVVFGLVVALFHALWLLIRLLFRTVFRGPRREFREK